MSDQKQVWIKCQTDSSNQVLPIGFCERLLADFAKATGHEVNLDEVIADDLLGRIVIVDQVSGHRAKVTLIAGQGKNAAFVEIARQEMRLGGTDAPL